MFASISEGENTSGIGIASQSFVIGEIRERGWNSEGPSVWKQPSSNLAANLLPFPHINLWRENGPRGLEIDRHVIIECGFSLNGSGAICMRRSLHNTFLILALINNPPMPLCNETLRNVFKYEANHILRTQSSDWGNEHSGEIGFRNEMCKWKCFLVRTGT